MLKPEQTLAIFMEENLGDSEGKMGYGVMRYSPNPITCVIDSRHAGKQVNDVVDMPRNCPVVANVEEARKNWEQKFSFWVSHPLVDAYLNPGLSN